ncbi:MAG: phage baseplate assembly protein V [Alphaproteobacteria bacterium]|nr:phage baseplate assembly protein V [Alphaproteobacteria bacterium]
MHTLSEMSRRLQNLVNLGTIAEVDHSSARVRVDINGRLTGWLPTPAAIGQNYRRWSPLRVGTQVLLVSPSGDPANAIIAQILYSDALPPPAATGEVDIIQFDDGTMVKYDAAAKRLELFSAGDIHIRATGTLFLDAAHLSALEG